MQEEPSSTAGQPLGNAWWAAPGQSFQRAQKSCCSLVPNTVRGGSSALVHAAPLVLCAPQNALSGIAERHPPPQPPTQAVLDPALLPLLHRRDFVGRFQHGNTATPGRKQRGATQHSSHRGPGNKPAVLELLCRSQGDQGI